MRPSAREADADGGVLSPTADRQAGWSNGPSHDPSYFPIAVWLQDAKNAAKYKAIGVNLYVALWNGPTAGQIVELKRQGMGVICEQNDFALGHLDEKTIVGWMHGDEPDNAQSLGRGKGYGPPISPAKIADEYSRIKARDPTRPVMLNLGQGVAWDGYYGRGVRTNHPEDYAEYVRGGDILSFDIYPAVHDHPAVAGKLWYVARGVERLRNWAGNDRIVWNCIECTRISNRNAKPTPRQVKAEVWMSLIFGSRGIIYFCHQFEPRFIEAALLADDEMAQAVGFDQPPDPCVGRCDPEPHHSRWSDRTSCPRGCRLGAKPDARDRPHRGGRQEGRRGDLSLCGRNGRATGQGQLRDSGTWREGYR